MLRGMKPEFSKVRNLTICTAFCILTRLHSAGSVVSQRWLQLRMPTPSLLVSSLHSILTRHFR